jgi:UDPglucose 6-dehydrogenase
MKIGVIGLGIIGNACKYGFEKVGHDVICHDIILDTKIEDVLDTEVCYICVPTPSTEGGDCDTSIVEEVVLKLNDLGYSGIIAIKSTVKLDTTEYLAKKINTEICFVPEFLRERCATTDFVENHKLLVVGTHSEFVYNMIIKCHGSLPEHRRMLKPTEAELLKYYSNVFNALKVIFANEMYEICKYMNINYKAIKDAFILRDTAKDIYLDVNDNFRGYGGMCLPKDTKAIDYFVKKNNLDLKLFETINNENNKFKTTVFEGMRLK